MVRYLIIFICISLGSSQPNENLDIIPQITPSSFARSYKSFRNPNGLERTQCFSISMGFHQGSPIRVASYNNGLHYKIRANLIADANFSIFNERGSLYSDIYGTELINEINSSLDAGLRYYPFNNGLFNIDVRSYHSGSSHGQSIDLDFLGITLKRFYQKGNYHSEHH